MEYIGHTSLHAYLKSKINRRLEEKEAKYLFIQIVKGIDYCHYKNIVHRDIKLENILLDENHNIKIIDFGFSIIIPNYKKLNIFCGTPSYMAPEIVNKIMYSGNSADVWALGILLYVMLNGKFPFKGFVKTLYLLFINKKKEMMIKIFLARSLRENSIFPQILVFMLKILL